MEDRDVREVSIRQVSDENRRQEPILQNERNFQDPRLLRRLRRRARRQVREMREEKRLLETIREEMEARTREQRLASNGRRT